MLNTKEDCIAAYQRLAKANPGKPITRDLYRKDSGIPRSEMEFHFGTFAELKRAADGDEPTRADKKLLNQVAKHVEAARRTELDTERGTYAEKYIRKDGGRFKTLLVASDLHDKEIDPFFLRVFLDTAKRVQPDAVCLGGDVFDLPEFGRFTVDPREWDAAGRIKFVHENILAPLRNNVPNAQIDLVEGNHECITPETEVRTDKGWVLAGLITPETNVASFDLATNDITYEPPKWLDSQEGRLIYEVETFFKKERITGNHRMLYDGKLEALEKLPQKLDGRNFTNCLITDPESPVVMDKNIVQFATWMITWGTVQTSADGYWVRFNHLSAAQMSHMKGVVQTIAGINWAVNNNGIDVTGPAMTSILEVITGQTDFEPNYRMRRLPTWFENLGPEYGLIVSAELTWAASTGFFSKNTSYYDGWCHAVGEDLQWFLVRRAVPAAITLQPHNKYNLKFNDSANIEHCRGGKVHKRLLEEHRVISIQTRHGTLITRLDGKINFTGNCRLVKHLADFSPATRAILGDLHGMTVGKFFGLDKYQVNYIGKADLKSFTERDHKRELENNYKVYWESVVVHHFPHGRHLGLPGVNGHHHSHIVWPMYNHHCGAYEWHQLGAGHRREASYCNGEKWHNGFALIHVDTLTRGVNIEYVPVANFAVVGGQFYYREASEFIGKKSA